VENADQTLVTAAQALATGWQRDMLQGGYDPDSAGLRELNLPAKRAPDDAPRWLQHG
jgi:hypothetical protein